MGSFTFALQLLCAVFGLPHLLSVTSIVGCDDRQREARDGEEDKGEGRESFSRMGGRGRAGRSAITLDAMARTIMIALECTGAE